MAAQKISITLRDDLYEWLDNKSDQQMVTKDALIETYLAEKYKEKQSGSDEQNKSHDETEYEGILDQFAERWHEIESEEYDYVVEAPSRQMDDYRYFTELDDVRESLRELYVE